MPEDSKLMVTSRVVSMARLDFRKTKIWKAKIFRRIFSAARDLLSAYSLFICIFVLKVNPF